MESAGCNANRFRIPRRERLCEAIPTTVSSAVEKGTVPRSKKGKRAMRPLPHGTVKTVPYRQTIIIAIQFVAKATIRYVFDVIRRERS